jgi:beta-glucosidase
VPARKDVAVLFDRFLAQGAFASAADPTGSRDLPRFTGASTDHSIEVSAFDVATQEDARRVVWHRPADLTLQWPSDATPGANATLHLRLRVPAAPLERVTLAAECTACTTTIDLSTWLGALAGKGWTTLDVPLACLGKASLGAIRLRSAAPFEIEFTQIAAFDRQTGSEGNKAACPTTPLGQAQ